MARIDMALTLKNRHGATSKDASAVGPDWRRSESTG
jgi:hypothetical protein